MKYNSTYHAAQVVGFAGDTVQYDGYIAPRQILIQEWNYIPCKYSQRTIALNDSHIWGVYKPINML